VTEKDLGTTSWGILSQGSVVNKRRHVTAKASVTSIYSGHSFIDTLARQIDFKTISAFYNRSSGNR
jgi:hypothetical protein